MMWQLGLLLLCAVQDDLGARCGGLAGGFVRRHGGEGRRTTRGRERGAKDIPDSLETEEADASVGCSGDAVRLLCFAKLCSPPTNVTTFCADASKNTTPYTPQKPASILAAIFACVHPSASLFPLEKRKRLTSTLCLASPCTTTLLAILCILLLSVVGLATIDSSLLPSASLLPLSSLLPSPPTPLPAAV